MTDMTEEEELQLEDWLEAEAEKLGVSPQELLQRGVEFYMELHGLA